MDTDDTPGEHRRFSRIALDSKVRLQAGEQTWETQLLDISLKGALIRRPPGWSAHPGDGFHLGVELSPEQGITMDVSVAHVEDEAVGFRCEHIDVESMGHLRRIVEWNTGDPDLLDRELAALVRPDSA